MPWYSFVNARRTWADPAIGQRQPTATTDATKDDDSHGREEVLRRDLNDAYLLIDYLSGLADVRLRDLQVKDAKGKEVYVVDEICRMRWPPREDSRQASEQAAILFKARDKLNELAAPATGLTIAYTMLVSAGESGRAELADAAYPGIVRSAKRFRFFMKALNWAVPLTVLVFIGLLSWSVVYGRTVLQRMDQLDTQRAEIAAVLDAAGQESRPRNPALVAETILDEAWLPNETTLKAQCAAMQERGPLTDGVVRACVAIKTLAEKREAADAELDAWTSPYRWLWHLPGVSQSPGPKPEQTRQWSAHLVAILGNSVLPMIYGLVGAAAAAMVNVNHKIKTNRLSPREFRMMRLRLVLGFLLGACIGSFLISSGTGAADSRVAGSTVSLSASAISFLAGFGVEGVIKMLENLLITAFGGDPPSLAPARPPSRGLPEM